MNTINLTGRLTRDPESRATGDGLDVCAMRLAVDGPRNAKTVFIDIAAFGQLAQTCSEYLDKGRHVAVTGRLDYSEWEAKDGGRRSKHEIIANQVDILAAAGDRTPEPASEAF